MSSRPCSAGQCRQCDRCRLVPARLPDNEEGWPTRWPSSGTRRSARSHRAPSRRWCAHGRPTRAARWRSRANPNPNPNPNPNLNPNPNPNRAAAQQLLGARAHRERVDVEVESGRARVREIVRRSCAREVRSRQPWLGAGRARTGGWSGGFDPCTLTCALAGPPARALGPGDQARYHRYAADACTPGQGQGRDQSQRHR